MVCLSVVCHTRAPCLNRLTDLDASTLVGSNDTVLDGGAPSERKNLGVGGRTHIQNMQLQTAAKPSVLCCHLVNTNEELARLHTDSAFCQIPLVLAIKRSSDNCGLCFSERLTRCIQLERFKLCTRLLPDYLASDLSHTSTHVGDCALRLHQRWSLHALCVPPLATEPSRRLLHLLGTVCRSQYGHRRHCKFFAAD